MQISYDKEADVMYVWFASVDLPYVNIENRNGDVVRISEKDGTVVGLILLFAMRRLKSGKPLDIPEISGSPLNEFAISLMRTEVEHPLKSLYLYLSHQAFSEALAKIVSIPRAEMQKRIKTVPEVPVSRHKRYKYVLAKARGSPRIYPPPSRSGHSK